MKKKIRTFLNLLLALIFLVSSSIFGLKQWQKAMGSHAYEDALALATSPAPAAAQPSKQASAESETKEQGLRWVAELPEESDPHVQQLNELNLEALREVNPQVIGWILIPDTEVNYPLLQGEDNDYYLNRTWDQKKNEVGSIFLEHLNSPDFTDFNTIVYGHNMIDGSMFASLRKYQKQSHWEEHPYVYIRNDQGVYRYEIFSSYLADVESNTYGIAFPGEDSEGRFLDWILSKSEIQPDVRPESTDRILTLSTCSGRGHTTRWVVHARLKMIQQEPS